MCEDRTGEKHGDDRVGGELEIKAKRKVRKQVKQRDNQTKIKVMLRVLPCGTLIFRKL